MSLKKVANLRELPITERFPETIGEENGGPEARKFSVYTLKGKSRGSQQ